MTKEEALNKIKELEKYIEDLDKSIGFDNDVIFLLSIDEYERYRDTIPHINTWWWLRSPGYRSEYAADVSSDGSVNANGINVHRGFGAARPVLKYANLELKISESKDVDCFIWNETKWKIIDKENKIAISYMPITFDKFDKDWNDYKNSYIRKWLLDWAAIEV